MSLGDKINILIVEDNEDYIFFIKKVLPSEKYSVKTISSGAEAFNYLSAENIPESIVLLDNRLPEMSGLEILEKLQDKKHNYAFIFLTVDNQIETVVKAMKTGALDFIVKSSNLKNELPEKIEKVYEIYKNRIELKKRGEELFIAKEKAKASESKFQLFTDNIPGIAFVKDIQHRYVYLNKEFEKVMNIKMSDWKGKTARELMYYPPDVIEELWLNDDKTVNKKKPIKVVEHLPVNNKMHHWLVVKFPLFDNNNNIHSVGGVGIDISKLIEAEKRLREKNRAIQSAFEKAERSEQKLNEAQHIAKIGSWEWDKSSNNVWWSDETYRIFDLDQKEFVPDIKNISKCLHSEDLQFYTNTIEYSINNGTKLNIDLRIITPNGLVKWCNIQGLAYFDDKNTASRFVGTILDITERNEDAEKIKEKSNEIYVQNIEYEKLNDELQQINSELLKAKDKLEESEMLFRAISEQATDGITITNKNGNYILVNPAFCIMTGYSDDELLKMKIFDLLENAEMVHDNPKSFGIPHGFSLKRKDNSVFPIQITVNSMRVARENLLLGIITDITLRKQTENLMNFNLRLAELNNDISISFINSKTSEIDKIINLAIGKLTLFAKANRGSLFQYSSESDTMTNTHEWCADAADSQIMLLQNIPSSTFGYCMEELLQHKTISISKFEDLPLKAKGERDWVKKHGFRSSLFVPVLRQGELWGAFGIYSKRGKEHRWVSAFIDFLNTIGNSVLTILIRKETEEKLIIAKEKAEESDRLKTEFINNMSHEIRTPMNGILGFSKFLSKDNLSIEKRNNYISIIQNSGNQLMRIIDDILEISKLGTQQVKVFEKEVCLNELLLEHFSIFDVKAKENKTPLYLKKGLSYKKSVILTDDSKLNKILSNLLENALKFTITGFIEFGYRLKLDSEPVEIEIYVKDTGIGINPDKQETIFKRFSQEEKELSKNVGGLGLGLSIAKENAELLGGKISLQSEKGKGATFFVTIPYKQIPSMTETNSSDNEEDKLAEKLDKHIILIVEDEEVSYLYVETLLGDEMELNCRILHAKNGKEAVELCKENSEIDFVVMDLKMPIMNGFDATKLIRGFRPDLPIIAQTAYTTKDDRDRAFSAGCNEFISKPIDEENLTEIVNKYAVTK